MKNLLILAFLFFALNSIANTKTFRVLESECSEVDPYIVGDACITVVSHGHDTRILVFDFYTASQDSKYLSIKTGSFLTLKSKHLIPITDKLVKEELSYFSDSFGFHKASYFNADLKSIKIAKLVPARNFNLECWASGVERLGLSANLLVKGRGTIYPQGFTSFDNLSFKYSLKDGEYDWSKGDISLDHIYNKTDYKPRKYKDYEKFSFHFWEDNSFGSIDLILPSQQLSTKSQIKTFKAFSIMTAIDDHWGSTVPMECKLVNTRF